MYGEHSKVIVYISPRLPLLSGLKRVQFGLGVPPADSSENGPVASRNIIYKAKDKIQTVSVGEKRQVWKKIDIYRMGILRPFVSL